MNQSQTKTNAKQYVDKYIVDGLRCNRCGGVLLREPESTRDGYPYQCLRCDENMFSIESHQGETASEIELKELYALAESLI